LFLQATQVIRGEETHVAEALRRAKGTVELKLKTAYTMLFSYTHFLVADESAWLRDALSWVVKFSNDVCGQQRRLARLLKSVRNILGKKRTVMDVVGR
jgi:hypothetical protein